jgi:hypothetical protein
LAFRKKYCENPNQTLYEIFHCHSPYFTRFYKIDRETLAEKRQNKRNTIELVYTESKRMSSDVFYFLKIFAIIQRNCLPFTEASRSVAVRRRGTVGNETPNRFYFFPI